MIIKELSYKNPSQKGLSNWSHHHPHHGFAIHFVVYIVLLYFSMVDWKSNIWKVENAGGAMSFFHSVWHTYWHKANLKPFIWFGETFLSIIICSWMAFLDNDEQDGYVLFIKIVLNWACAIPTFYYANFLFSSDFEIF